MIPSTTFQIVRIASWVMEKAAMSSVAACPRRVATSSAWVWPTPPGVIAKIPPGEHVRRGDEEDCERRDRDREGCHEDDVHADPAAVRQRRRERDLAEVAPPVL